MRRWRGSWLARARAWRTTRARDVLAAGECAGSVLRGLRLGGGDQGDARWGGGARVHRAGGRRAAGPARSGDREPLQAVAAVASTSGGPFARTARRVRVVATTRTRKTVADTET